MIFCKAIVTVLLPICPFLMIFLKLNKNVSVLKIYLLIAFGGADYGIFDIIFEKELADVCA